MYELTCAAHILLPDGFLMQEFSFKLLPDGLLVQEFSFKVYMDPCVDYILQLNVRSSWYLGIVFQCCIYTKGIQSLFSVIGRGLLLFVGYAYS
jgi:hypothetical protein